MPARVVGLGRTARNRTLDQLPNYDGRGHPPSYGTRAKTPAQWLKERQGWQTATVEVRGKR